MNHEDSCALNFGYFRRLFLHQESSRYQILQRRLYVCYYIISLAWVGVNLGDRGKCPLYPEENSGSSSLQVGENDAARTRYMLLVSKPFLAIFYFI